MSAPSIWRPIRQAGQAGSPSSGQRVLTSAELLEAPDGDLVTLFIQGQFATEFTVAAGLGAQLLAECGLERRA